jgi:formylmethanofuran dehydrogenase subunit D
MAQKKIGIQWKQVAIAAIVASLSSVAVDRYLAKSAATYTYDIGKLNIVSASPLSVPDHMDWKALKEGDQVVVREGDMRGQLGYFNDNTNNSSSDVFIKVHDWQTVLLDPETLGAVIPLR